MTSFEGGNSIWPLSRVLLREIINDRISDTFVAGLIWERLGYRPAEKSFLIWEAGPCTPLEWLKEFPTAPQIISQRKASVKLTRSIPKEFKQLLKKELDFSGYRIGELYPRKTRRATAVNWLLAWLAIREEALLEDGPLPKILEPPVDPLTGHPGDPVVK